MVDFEPNRGEGLTAFMSPYRIPKEPLPGVAIGRGTRDSLVPEYRSSIERSAILVF